MGGIRCRVFLTLLLLLFLSPLVFSNAMPLAAMKGGSNGYLYVPSSTYEPNVTAIKIEEWCNMSTADCQTNNYSVTKCGCDRLQCDQAGGVNPYYSLGNGPLYWGSAQWPDSQITGTDAGYEGIWSAGTAEGFNSFPFSPWEYEADCVPDRSMQMSDINPAWFDQNFTGTYSTDVSNINVVFDTAPGTHVPLDASGFVGIPAGATSFTVYNGTNPVMTLVTFWNSSYVSSAPNNCGYYSGSSSACGAPNNYCSSGNYFPTQSCSSNPTYSSCIAETAATSCAICGNCAGGSDTCSVVACGTSNSYGCSNVCSGQGTGAANCAAPGGTSATCYCNAMCTSGTCNMSDNKCLANYQSTPNLCGYQTSGSVGCAAPTTNYCSSGTFYPTQACSPAPANFACIAESSATSCAVCGNCAGGSDTCAAATCGTNYDCGGGNICTGKNTGPANCIAPHSLGDGQSCLCTDVCVDGDTCISGVCTPTYCNTTWTTTPDFRTTPNPHYSHVVNQLVTVAVLLTNSSGGAVSGKSVTITVPLPGSPATVISDAVGNATAKFTLPTTAGQFSPLSVTAPKCTNGILAQNTITSYIYAFHDSPFQIAITEPPPPAKTVYVDPGDIYNVSIEIQDQYGNICNDSFDGIPYNSTNTSPFNATIAMTQTLSNSSDTWTYTTPQCAVLNPTPCFVVFNNSVGGGNEGKYRFQLFAYVPANHTRIDKIVNDFEEITLTLGTNLTNSAFTPTGAITGNSMTVIYNPPPVPVPHLNITMTPHQISTGDSFNITIKAINPDGTLDTTYNKLVEVHRLQRADAPQITDWIINGSATSPETTCKLVNGQTTFLVNSSTSLGYFNLTGLYRIAAWETLTPSINGTGILLVGNGGIDHLNVTVYYNGVFRTLNFSAVVSARDAGDNVVENFTGEMNISCPPLSTDPMKQTAELTPKDYGQTIFVETANESGIIWCNVSAYDIASRAVVEGNFSVFVAEPLMCTAYSIPPIPTLNPPFDVKTGPPFTYITPPVSTVMNHNDQVGPSLIGYDPATGQMNGNYSICLESYHNGRLCLNQTDVQFDVSPISVCVKEFVYNPESDGFISDHINYNGVDNLEDTFKHPEIVWGWGYNASDKTYSNCSMDPLHADNYTIKLTPGPVHEDYFNVTVTLPLGPLEPYNITNDTPLNPLELTAPSGLMVMDKFGGGRLAKFNMTVPAVYTENYSNGTANEYAQAIAYDNRGNVFVALTEADKVIVLKVSKSASKTLDFVTAIDTVTPSGTKFLPSGLDTDSWGNLYVVGNTDPDQSDNMVCINKYNSSWVLNDSNNCCGYQHADGTCEENYWGNATGITVTEDGSTVYVVRDKKWTCDFWSCYWSGNPLIYEYNASNVTQSVSNFSIFGQDQITFYNDNPVDYTTDGACYNNAGTGSPILGPQYDNPQNHYLRGIKARRGYLFIIDYMSYIKRGPWWGCKGCPVWPFCCGGCWPFNDNTNCNSCNYAQLYENQMTRLIAMDMTPGNENKAYRARAVIEPNMTVEWLGIVDYTTGGAINAAGLQTIDGLTYDTHGIDVDNDLNVFVALEGHNNEIVQYKFDTTGGSDGTLKYDGGSYSFIPMYGWSEGPIIDPTSSYQVDTAGSWTSPYASVTDNVTRPDAVIAYPDMIKASMMAGVSCQGCSMAGAVTPSACGTQVSNTNQSQYNTINTSLASSNIIPGTPVVHLALPTPAVYKRNSISTNITAFLRFDYKFDITKYTGGCVGSPTATTPYPSVSKTLNITSYSNNLERLAEGGGQYFAFTSPSYPEKPAIVPNTLPYLAYNYFTNRFFYKHFALMDNVTSSEGNINTMGPSPNDFWNGGVAGPNLPLSYPVQWCNFFPGVCPPLNDPSLKEWLLNASYRKTFEIFQNQYYGYQFLASTPTVGAFNEQTPIYGAQETWDNVLNKWMGQDLNADAYLNPDITSTYAPGMIPLNNTMNWSYPFAYNFSPLGFQPNPLPFRPQDNPPSPASDYLFTAITNVSILQLSIECRDSAGNELNYTVTVTNNSGWIPVGSCLKIDAIAVTGASGIASLIIRPQGLPDYDDLCFEAIGGANSSLCALTRAWFREAIQPNTVVAFTNNTVEIPMSTRYPLSTSGPYGAPPTAYPASLMVLPVNMSGPTLLTLHGRNATWNGSGGNDFDPISATANMAGRELPNPLPINITNLTLYFRSDADTTFTMRGVDGGNWNVVVNYVASSGWVQIPGVGNGTSKTGMFNEIESVTCVDPLGCLFQFSNDSIGSYLLGEAFLGQHIYQISGFSQTTKYPDTTYDLPKGAIQFVPDDPNNRNFIRIDSISGKGYLGDQFNVYTDPAALIRIDNISVGTCIACTKPSDCPIGITCDIPNSVCKTQDCGVAMHPAGLPCPPSFVCPKIDLSAINDSLTVASDHDHNANNNTIITIVGTDASPTFELQNDTITLGGATPYISNGGTNFTLIGNHIYSGVYIIDVKNAIKGETLYFRTNRSSTDLGSIYIPVANYTDVSSIGSIYPNPRKLMITSDNPMPHAVHYIIKGTNGTSQVFKEDNTQTPSVKCTLPAGPSVSPDPLFNNGECTLRIDSIPDQAVGVPFKIRITSVSTGFVPPPPPPIQQLNYPSTNFEEDQGLCTAPGSGILLTQYDGNGACLTTPPAPSPSYLTPAMLYPMWDFMEGNEVNGNRYDAEGSIDNKGPGIKTWWGSIWPCTEHEGILIYKSNSPINVSALNLRIKTSNEGRKIYVRMSTDSSCAPSGGTNPIGDWSNADMTDVGNLAPTGSGNTKYLDNIMNFSPLKYTNIYCIGLYTEHVCMGWGCPLICGAQQEFYVDTLGVVEDVVVTPPPPPPPSFVGYRFSSPIDIDGFNVTAEYLGAIPSSNTFTILASKRLDCLTHGIAVDNQTSNWDVVLPMTLSTSSSWTNNVQMLMSTLSGTRCLGFLESTDVNAQWSIDSVGVFKPIPVPPPPPRDCSSFGGNVKLSDSGNMCPTSAGPFIGGVWSGNVMVPNVVTPDSITATNDGATTTSNSFNVQAVPGSASASFETVNQFTHVLAIEIFGNQNEHFNVTTAPLISDYPDTDVAPEQIGVVNVIPNDFTVGFHQNVSGTFIYSQQDSLTLNIPDNNSLGLHNFDFMFFDRFNNTFIVPYTLWLRQPTSITLGIITSRDASDPDLTYVDVTGLLLYQRYDKPQEKPNTPIGPGYNISIYIQNSTDEMYNEGGCHPLSGAGAVCPVAPEVSNCSCPDWVDDKNSPGDCIPNWGAPANAQYAPPVANCHQFGWLPNATGGKIFTTNATGQVHTNFKIYGFGRRLMFAVFDGTRDYAPSIQIVPFYAGGLSIAVGSFSVLEPVLLILIALGLMTLKRKFNKQKINNI